MAIEGSLGCGMVFGDPSGREARYEEEDAEEGRSEHDG